MVKFFSKFKKILLTIIVIIAALLVCFACQHEEKKPVKPSPPKVTTTVSYRPSLQPETLYIFSHGKVDTLIYRPK